MQRRRFLSLLGLTPAVAAVDKKSLLSWLKSAFKPKPVYSAWVTRQSVEWFSRQLNFAQHANLAYEREFSRELPVGQTIRVKFPQRYEVR